MPRLLQACLQSQRPPCMPMSYASAPPTKVAPNVIEKSGARAIVVIRERLPARTLMKRYELLRLRIHFVRHGRILRRNCTQCKPCDTSHPIFDLAFIRMLGNIEMPSGFGGHAHEGAEVYKRGALGPLMPQATRTKKAFRDYLSSYLRHHVCFEGTSEIGRPFAKDRRHYTIVYSDTLTCPDCITNGLRKSSLTSQNSPVNAFGGHDTLCISFRMRARAFSVATNSAKKELSICTTASVFKKSILDREVVRKLLSSIVFIAIIANSSFSCHG